MRKVSQNMIDKAELALVKIQEEFGNDPNIRGYAIGYKERGSQLINRCAVRVYVYQKFPTGLLKPERRLPKEIDGIAIDVIERQYKLHSNPLDKHDPIMGGVMIANENNDDHVGTLGAIVNRKGSGGGAYILSNWHVLYGRQDAVAGEKIVQPSFGSSNVVAETSIGLLTSKVDCALAKLNDRRLVKRSILEIAPSISNRPANVTIGLEVVKFGVNGFAFGIVEAVKKSDQFLAPWSNEIYKFEDQIEIRPIDNKDFNINVGDSGALWVTDDNLHKPVGLHFAGEPNLYSLANPIKNVIESLKDKNYVFAF